jgi:hypothetical protein
LVPPPQAANENTHPLSATATDDGARHTAAILIDYLSHQKALESVGLRE